MTSGRITIRWMTFGRKVLKNLSQNSAWFSEIIVVDSCDAHMRFLA